MVSRCRCARAPRASCGAPASRSAGPRAVIAAPAIGSAARPPCCAPLRHAIWAARRRCARAAAARRRRAPRFVPRRPHRAAPQLRSWRPGKPGRARGRASGQAACAGQPRGRGWIGEKHSPSLPGILRCAGGGGFWWRAVRERRVGRGQSWSLARQPGAPCAAPAPWPCVAGTVPARRRVDCQLGAAWGAAGRGGYSSCRSARAPLPPAPRRSGCHATIALPHAIPHGRSRARRRITHTSLSPRRHRQQPERAQRASQPSPVARAPAAAGAAALIGRSYARAAAAMPQPAGLR
jgi:hypothetical protein